jgi:F-type H+-transporting ATPase subunit a
VAAESGKIDPMHQFMIEPIFGRDWQIAGHSIAFTNSALWMVITLGALWLFMLGGMKRELVPGRWQAAVEGFTGFISNMMHTNIGPKGKAFVPYVFSLFMFILIANLLGMLPLGIIPGVHPFTVTSHLTVTGILAIVSFSIVLIEFFSFMIRPFSLGLRLFVAMTAGHILLKVLAGFVINGMNAGAGIAAIVSLPSFVLMVGITLLELLVCAIQAYVFALLTSLYLNDAINLH